MFKVQIGFGNESYTIEATIEKQGNKWYCRTEDIAVEAIGFSVSDAVSKFKTACRNN